jgi:hypothetical protein
MTLAINYKTFFLSKTLLFGSKECGTVRVLYWPYPQIFCCCHRKFDCKLCSPPGMGEIEKVGDLKSQNLAIENCSRNTGIQKSHIGSVKISPLRKKSSILTNRYNMRHFSNNLFSKCLILISLKQ